MTEGKMIYGHCWTCDAPVVSRTRGIPTIDTCQNGHKHDASLTLRGEMRDEITRLRAEVERLRQLLGDAHGLLVDGQRQEDVMRLWSRRAEKHFARVRAALAALAQEQTP